MKPYHFAAILVRSIALFGILLSGYFFLSAHGLHETAKITIAELKALESTSLERPSKPLFGDNWSDNMLRQSIDRTNRVQEASVQGYHRLIAVGVIILLSSLAIFIFSKIIGKFLCIGINCESPENTVSKS